MSQTLVISQQYEQYAPDNKTIVCAGLSESDIVHKMTNQLRSFREECYDNDFEEMKSEMWENHIKIMINMYQHGSDDKLGYVGENENDENQWFKFTEKTGDIYSQYTLTMNQAPNTQKWATLSFVVISNGL